LGFAGQTQTEKFGDEMSFLFWAFAAAMLVIAVAFIVVPLRTGKSLFDTPIALVVTLLPFSAVCLYAFLGSNGVPAVAHTSAATGQSASTDASDEGSLGSVASMLDGLAARLEKEPDDADGWILLARSYQHIGQRDDAIAAYEKAQALGKSDANLDALLFGNLEGSQQSMSEPRGPAIRGRVALSPDAAAKVLPTDTLFIFAKESRDDRMPVVALRKSASELPLEFALTDEQVMVPGTQISDYEQLVVTAKISRSGNASDDSLGLEVWSDTISPTSDDRIDLLVSTNPGSSND
jgi:hypothetical protein